MGKRNLAIKQEDTVTRMTISEELLAIQSMNDGLIDPIKVVDYARNPDTSLHKKFQWDDTIAAEKYRIYQARQIIRLELVIVHQDTRGKVHILSDVTEEKGKIVRAFVSLEDDRQADDVRGYRSVMDVLSHEDLRVKLLEQAKNDMNIFLRKYSVLTELAKVFEAMNEII
jgi:hypothetical protein